MYKPFQKILFIWLCFSLGYLSHPLVLLANEAKFIPPEGKILFLIGQNQESIKGYISAAKAVPAGMMVYTSLQRAEGLDSPAEYGSGVQHAQYLLRAYPHSVIQIGLYMVGAALFVSQGTYD